MMRENKRWNYADLAFIRENYATMTRWQLAYHFGVKETAMDGTIRRYGLKKRDLKQQG